METIQLGLPLKKKIKGQCPCGYCFETFRSEEEAIVLMQTHIETFHQDMLPFGITSQETLALLKVEYSKPAKKPKFRRDKPPRKKLPIRRADLILTSPYFVQKVDGSLCSPAQPKFSRTVSAKSN
jgi:hypothetical protein